MSQCETDGSRMINMTRLCTLYHRWDNFAEKLSKMAKHTAVPLLPNYLFEKDKFSPPLGTI